MLEERLEKSHFRWPLLLMHSTFPSPCSPNQARPAPREGFAGSLCLLVCDAIRSHSSAHTCRR